MTQTENYYLKKPSYSDPIDVGDLNDNFDAIDDIMKTNADSIFGKYTKPSGGIPESDLSAVVRGKLDAQDTTILGASTPNFNQGSLLSNFTINGEIATEEEIGAASFESNRVEFHITESNVDGAGKHGLQVLRLNDRYGDDTVTFTNWGYGQTNMVVIDKIDEFTYDIQLVVQ